MRALRACFVLLPLALSACGASSSTDPRATETGRNANERPAEPAVPPPVPPGQPAQGPGGSDYPYSGEPLREGPDGFGGFTVYLPSPQPSEALPLVVLLRGGCGNGRYHAEISQLGPTGVCNQTKENVHLQLWRRHLVQKGNIVVFPHYQRDDEPEVEQQNVASAVLGAIELLRTSGYAVPDLDRFGIGGHSRGSQMTVMVASRFQELGLPQPRWLLVVEPGPTSEIDFSRLANIPAETKVVVVVGEHDQNAGENVPGAKAVAIWDAIQHIPAANRDYVRVRSDRRGAWALTPQVQVSFIGVGLVPGYDRRPAGDLLADHFFPGSVDALDIHALWKISQALIDCTGRALHCEFALGDTGEQRFVGVWSDGASVKELCVTDRPDETWDESCAPSSTD